LSCTSHQEHQPSLPWQNVHEVLAVAAFSQNCGNMQHRNPAQKQANELIVVFFPSLYCNKM
jgi:hypothetical protein